MTLRSIEIMPQSAYDSPSRVSSTDANFQVVLADGVAQTVTVSTLARYARLTGSKDFFAAFGSTVGGSTQLTAVIPSSTVSAGNYTEHFAGAKGENWKFLGECTNLSIIASSAMTVGVQLWKE